MTSKACRFLLVNPSHTAVSSRCHKGKMPPLGLLSIGGPLIDKGYDVRLVDADVGPLSIAEISDIVSSWGPDAVLMGATGSTSAHPQIVKIASAVKQIDPAIRTIYGGVFPTFHAEDILHTHPEIDIIVRGEGESTIVHVADAIVSKKDLHTVKGIAFRKSGYAHLTPPADLIQNLDEFRVGWELIEDWDVYHYWGKKRSAVIQFSRGCIHHCSYCGQRDFWVRWRHRDPESVVREIAWLYHEKGVEFVDIGDENPTSNRQLWKFFLERLIEENLPVQLITTIRADDIVRDADILHLYKKAGFARILMGTETTNPKTLVKIKKGSDPNIDRKAIKLLREHDILSQACYLIGLTEETDADYFFSLKHLIKYDPDQINVMYATPHRWTAFHEEDTNRRVIEPDLSRWDYRHQVFKTHIPAWRVFLWAKITEAVIQLHPRAIYRLLAHRDPEIRKAIRWCYNVAWKALLHEFYTFFQASGQQKIDMSLAEFWAYIKRPRNTPYRRKNDLSPMKTRPLPVEYSNSMIAGEENMERGAHPAV